MLFLHKCMKRKVIKLASNTLVVSLPSKWAKKHNIKKGDEVDLKETPHNIIISSQQVAKKKTKLVLNNNPEQARRQINLAYRRGFDEIEVEYDNHKAYSAAVSELQKLIGFEIISSSKNHSKIRNIATEEVENFDVVFRRFFLSVLEISEAATEYSSKHDDAALDHVLVGVQNTNKLGDFCKRLLNKQGLSDITHTTLMLGALKDLERLSDQYATLTNFTVSKEFLPALTEVHRLLRSLYSLFYSFDQSKADVFSEKINLLENNLSVLIKNNNAAVAHHLTTVVKLLKELSDAVYGRAL